MEIVTFNWTWMSLNWCFLCYVFCLKILFILIARLDLLSHEISTHFEVKKNIMPPLLQTLTIELLKSIWSLINDEKSVKILVESLIKTWGVHLNEAAGLQLVILLKNMNSFKDVVKEFCGIFDFQGTLIPRNTSVDHFWRV